MKAIAFAVLALLALGCASAEQSHQVSAQEPTPPPEMPEAAAASEQHAWLQQLVGEWSVSAEMPAAPGAEPMRLESTETVRALGELWILNESSASIGGQPFKALMTVGYDPRKEAFVGTWVDTMQPVLWVYEGRLDTSGKKLVLEAEGPSFSDPSKTARYRDSIEILAPDRKLLTSEMQGADGTWTLFMRAEARRTK